MSSPPLHSLFVAVAVQDLIMQQHPSYNYCINMVDSVAIVVEIMALAIIYLPSPILRACMGVTMHTLAWHISLCKELCIVCHHRLLAQKWDSPHTSFGNCKMSLLYFSTKGITSAEVSLHALGASFNSPSKL